MRGVSLCLYIRQQPSVRAQPFLKRTQRINSRWTPPWTSEEEKEEGEGMDEVFSKPWTAPPTSSRTAWRSETIDRSRPVARPSIFLLLSTKATLLSLGLTRGRKEWQRRGHSFIQWFTTSISPPGESGWTEAPISSMPWTDKSTLSILCARPFHLLVIIRSWS